MALWGNSDQGRVADSGGGSTPAAPAATPLATVQGTAAGISKEFSADNPVRMPTSTDNALLAAARARREMQAASGRDSTRLVGTQVYSNSWLGSV